MERIAQNVLIITGMHINGALKKLGYTNEAFISKILDSLSSIDDIKNGLKDSEGQIKLLQSDFYSFQIYFKDIEP